MPTPNEIAAQMIARCAAGFQNEHHWKNWRKTYGKQIAALPPTLQAKVLLAYDQASTPEPRERAR